MEDAAEFLAECIKEAQRTGDPAALFGSALQVATAHSRRDSIDNDTAVVLGWFYFYCYLALPNGHPSKQHAIAESVRCFGKVPYSFWKSLPGQLRELVRTFATKSAVEPLTAIAVAVDENAKRAGDALQLSQAIAVYNSLLSVLADNDPWRLIILNDRAITSRARAASTQQRSDHDDAVDMAREYELAAPDGTSDHVVAQSGLGMALSSRYRITGVKSDLAEAIRLQRSVVARTAPNDPRAPGRKRNLANSLMLQAIASEKEDDIDAAITAIREALQSADENDVGRAGLLSNLMTLMRLRHQHSGDLQHIEGIIEYAVEAEAALRTYDDDDPDRANVAYMIAAAYVEQYKQSGSVADLDHAIRILRSLSESVLRRNPEVANFLARNLMERFRTTKDVADARAASQIFAMSLSDDLGVDVLLSSVRSLIAIYECLGDRSCLDEAVHFARSALTKAESETKDWAMATRDLLCALLLRYEATGATEDLEESVTVSRHAAGRAIADPASTGLIWEICAAAFVSRYERFAEVVDIEFAIEFLERAISVTYDLSWRVALLANAGDLWLSKYRFSGDPNDIAMAIARVDEATVSIGKVDARTDTIVRYIAGKVALERYRRSGEYNQLASALRFLRKAHGSDVNVAQLRSGLSLELGAALRMEYERSGYLDALKEAVRLLTEAARITRGVTQAAINSELCNTLHTMFRETADRADIDAAVAAGESAIAGTLEDHPEYALRLDNLGLALASRYRITHSLDDLNKAVEASHLAVVRTPRTHVRRAAAESNLGLHLRLRFIHTNDFPDIQRAIDAAESAVAGTRVEDFEWAKRVLNLGTTYRVRAAARKQNGDSGFTEDLRVASEHYRRVAEQRAVPPVFRCEGAQSWGEVEVLLEDWSSALDAYRLALEMFVLLPARHFSHESKKSVLAQFAELGSEAAAVAIQAGHVADGLAFLEQGRGVLLGHALDLREDLTPLQERHPDLAARFDAIRVELSSQDTPPGQDPASWRRDRFNELDALLTQIRSLEGFERFLLPPDSTELVAASTSGPLVAINVSQWRCDAIVVSEQLQPAIQSVPLEQLKRSEVVERVNSFLAEVGKSNRAANDILRKTLNWLWSAVVEPVARWLAQQGINFSDLRLWWLPTGPLALLPIHAAQGTTSDLPKSSALELMTSSYTPTVRALLAARRRSVADRVTPLAVGVSRALPRGNMRYEDLPYAAAEARMVSKKLGDHVPPLVDTEATQNNVLAGMAVANLVHLACHAVGHRRDLAAAYLVLHDVDLSMQDILDLHRPPGRLAYISACATGFSGKELSDESLHIAAAFHVIGFRHVIATLWPIYDVIAVKMAEEFYSELSSDAHDAARAIRAAVLKIKEDHENYPILWASYLHIGP